MTGEAPYDRWATEYRDWWAPVIAPSAIRLLDRLDGVVPSDRATTIVDIGTGSGTLALEAIRRWPAAHVIAVDPARRLLAMVEASATEAGVADRLEALRGEAGALPVADAVADVAVSSFVMQLTPDRSAAVREAFRVLRPGGTFAHVTWLIDDRPWAPDDVFLDAIEALGIEPAERPDGDDDRSYASVRGAADELRRAGFRSVEAREVWMEHRFTPATYAALAEHWTEDDTFAPLRPPMRRRLRAELERRLARLRPDELLWRRPLVRAVAVRPAVPAR